MLSMLYVRLTIKVKVEIPESFKVGWYRHILTGSSHLKDLPPLSVMRRYSLFIATKENPTARVINIYTVN